MTPEEAAAQRDEISAWKKKYADDPILAAAPPPSTWTPKQLAELQQLIGPLYRRWAKTIEAEMAREEEDTE